MNCLNGTPFSSWLHLKLATQVAFAVSRTIAPTLEPFTIEDLMMLLFFALSTPSVGRANARADFGNIEVEIVKFLRQIENIFVPFR